VRANAERCRPCDGALQCRFSSSSPGGSSPT
jgi:hypothetical protein